MQNTDIAAPSLEITTSRQMLAWLEEQQLSIALTTYQIGKLFLLGLKPGGELSVFERSFNRCMGLCPTDNGFYLSSLHQVWRFFPLAPVPAQVDQCRELHGSPRQAGGFHFQAQPQPGIDRLGHGCNDTGDQDVTPLQRRVQRPCGKVARPQARQRQNGQRSNAGDQRATQQCATAPGMPEPPGQGNRKHPQRRIGPCRPQRRLLQLQRCASHSTQKHCRPPAHRPGGAG